MAHPFRSNVAARSRQAGAGAVPSDWAQTPYDQPGWPDSGRQSLASERLMSLLPSISGFVLKHARPSAATWEKEWCCSGWSHSQVPRSQTRALLQCSAAHAGQHVVAAACSCSEHQRLLDCLLKIAEWLVTSNPVSTQPQVLQGHCPKSSSSHAVRAQAQQPWPPALSCSGHDLSRVSWPLGAAARL